MKMRLQQPIQAMLLLAVLIGAQGAALAATMTDIQFTPRPGGRFEVRLKFDGPVSEPKGYTIERPARIALDFAGVASGLNQKKYPLSFDNASGALILQSQGRTRLVLNLVELAPYNSFVDGNEVTINVGSAQARDFLKKNNYSAALKNVTRKSQVAVGNEVSDMDFRRGNAGEGRLVLTLSNPAIDIDVSVQGSRIQVDLADTTLPEKLRRRYDVGDFATPVKIVDANVNGSNTLFSIKAEGDYDYLAYQTDNKYVVEVKPLTKFELEKRKEEFTYTGEKLSLNFQDIEVRSVLQIIADFTSLNLVASDTVTGNITLRLKNVPWDQALELVLKTKGLDQRKVGNVLMIGPSSEIAERERLQIEAQKQVQELAPLQTEFVRVRYASASEIFKFFVPGDDGGGDETASGSILSPRGSVIVDERTNSLLITETAEKLEEFRRLLNQIDVPVRQVMIEARIVRANDTFDQSIGVRWSGASVGERTLVGNSIENNRATYNSFVTSGNNGGTPTITTGLLTDLGANLANGSIAIGYIGSDTLLDLELSALENSGGGEVVSQPKVITGDKEQAIIKSGTEIPFPETSGNGETTISFKEAVLKLEVTPTITPDNRIIMDLVINQDSVGDLIIATGLGGQVPTIDTTELITQVLVGNGETIVLGGVYNMSKIKTTSKVPLLGDIPVLGRLFKSTTVSQEKQETLVFITPRILADSLID